MSSKPLGSYPDRYLDLDRSRPLVVFSQDSAIGGRTQIPPDILAAIGEPAEKVQCLVMSLDDVQQYPQIVLGAGQEDQLRLGEPILLQWRDIESVRPQYMPAGKRRAGDVLEHKIKDALNVLVYVICEQSSHLIPLIEGERRRNWTAGRMRNEIVERLAELPYQNQIILPARRAGEDL